ncbi:molybdopterin-guanine dinucleotide biosynthesis protein B [Paenibacillus sp. HN-1]|nr:molybdopterin-guanine dinucleotide biosynthesis protein B [Paenibacillus sp. CGMCC 1.18879]MBY9082098.1 molybdopterin-guanine dinucleotide biosynthesis protein B [Paenibacillus sp. CGMCC 1.18879]MBY9085744.1 molybdopterin-guanine dinucleotide biosynthesis protein B [Paenibacillus sinensis]
MAGRVRSFAGQAGRRRPVVCQIVGYKNRGKTTLIAALIPILREQGFSVAVIKHDVHGFEADQPGTDTWLHREAGAEGVSITSNESSFVWESRSRRLKELISGFCSYDYVLVEGFKNEDFPKMVLVREHTDLELIGGLKNVRAAVCWPAIRASGEFDTLACPVFEIGDLHAVAGFLQQQRTLLSNYNI